MRILFTFAVAFALMAQEAPRHDKYADDKDAYCWNPRSSGSMTPRRERDPHAHKCECHLLCSLDENGAIVGDHEDQGCELYCTRTHCDCHRDESPCEKPSGSGSK